MQAIKQKQSTMYYSVYKNAEWFGLTLIFDEGADEKIIMTLEDGLLLEQLAPSLIGTVTKVTSVVKRMAKPSGHRTKFHLLLNGILYCFNR